MIYVFANDDRGLSVYATKREAVAACEGIDVKDGNYKFFSSDGRPLQVSFTRFDRPDYTLEPPGEPVAPGLRDILAQVSYVEGCGLSTVPMVEARIAEVEHSADGNSSHGSEPGGLHD